MGDRLPSLTLMLELARAQRAELRTHFESLDQKAGLVLAGAGVFATLSSDLPGPWASVASLLAVASAACALAAFWPRDFPSVGLMELRRWLRAEEAVTRLMVVDTLAGEEPRTRALLAAKARRLKWAMAVLFLAAATAGAGVASSASGGANAGTSGTETGSFDRRAPSAAASPSSAKS